MIGARSKSSIAVSVGGTSDLAGSIEVRDVNILPFGTRRAGCLGGTVSRPLFIRAPISGGSWRLFVVVILFILFLTAGGHGKEKEDTNN